MFRNYHMVMLLIGVVSAAPPQPVTIIKMATLAPEGTDWYGMLVEMGQEWNRRTNGEIVLRIYPGGVVGDERDMVRKMRIGQIQAAAITAEGLTDIDPNVTVFFTPLLFQNYDDVDWVRTQISSDLEKGIEAGGFKVIYWADVGWVYWFSTTPFSSPEELQKLKMFSWAGDVKTDILWEQAGFRVVPLAITEILMGLQTGLIDVMASTPIFALSTQTFGIAKYMLDMRWGLLTAAVVLDVRTWNDLSARNQATMEIVAREIGRKHQQKNRYNDAAAIESMKKYGLEVHQPTAEELERWETMVTNLYPNMRGSFIPEEIFDRVMELMSQRASSKE